MQRPIQQRGGVAVRQDETVPVDPLRVRWVMLHQLVIEQVSDRRATKRSAGMTGLSLFNGVNGEKSEGVDGKLVQFLLFQILLFAHSFPFLSEETRTRSATLNLDNLVDL